jgi:MFS family permease
VFWFIGLGFFFFALGINGIMAHFVPLLTDRGFEPVVAALMASTLGLMMIAGRIVIGLCLDYQEASVVASICFLASATGMGLVAGSAHGGLTLLAAILLGVGIGAQSNILSFMVSRHFGLRSYGVIYGFMYNGFTLGGAFSPLILGLGFELLGNYESLLWVHAGIIVIAALLISRAPCRSA